uniref:F-box domain-containing protein n=1 Tax=Brassica oleracea var. oleracea TaxID=109376 RepID=A0A0D3CWK6_BRAOL
MTTMLDLPDELIDDIFSRVPSESVRAARSTCKAWNALFYRWFAKKMEHNVKVTWKKQGSQTKKVDRDFWFGTLVWEDSKTRLTRLTLFSPKMRSLLFSLHRRRSRRRLPPALMAKKKPPKKQPSDRLPTGATNPSSSKQPSSAPDSSSAAKSKKPSVSALAGSPTQTTQTPIPAQEVFIPILAIDTETPKSKTLATVNPIVPGSATHSLAPPETGKPTTIDKAPPPIAAQQSPADLWKGSVKEASVKLFPKETPYTLYSGEKCVTIPNAVVEKNKKAWECFILGQFYEEAPARGAVHAIVNGIWSRQRWDITVNKMDGNAYLFRVPCPNVRRQMVPVWLELTGVPLQFFNKDALQEIAGLVGHPVCLHPATENLTNIEVAKVYTVIDPREPLPEFKFGHTISRCKSAPRTCETCNSVKHTTAAFPRTNHLPPDLRKQKGKAPIKSLLPIVGQPKTARKAEGTKPVETFETVASNYEGT